LISQSSFDIIFSSSKCEVRVSHIIMEFNDWIYRWSI